MDVRIRIRAGFAGTGGLPGRLFALVQKTACPPPRLPGRGPGMAVPAGRQMKSAGASKADRRWYPAHRTRIVGKSSGSVRRSGSPVSDIVQRSSDMPYSAACSSRRLRHFDAFVGCLSDHGFGFVLTAKITGPYLLFVWIFCLVWPESWHVSPQMTWLPNGRACIESARAPVMTVCCYRCLLLWFCRRRRRHPVMTVCCYRCLLLWFCRRRRHPVMTVCCYRCLLDPTHNLRPVMISDVCQDHAAKHPTEDGNVICVAWSPGPVRVCRVKTQECPKHT